MTIIVDDNEVDRYIIKRQVAKHPAFGTLLEARNGMEFLCELLESGKVDEDQPQPVVVLMDINMPGMDGFEAAERLQERIQQGKGPEKAAVMMVSSSENPKDRARAESLEIVKGYIVKPLGQKDLDNILPLLNG